MFANNQNPQNFQTPQNSQNSQNFQNISGQGSQTSTNPNISPEMMSNMFAGFDPSSLSDLMKPNVMNAINSLSESIEVIKREAPSFLPSLAKMMGSQNPYFPSQFQDYSGFENTQNLVSASTSASQPKNFDKELETMKDMGLLDDEANRTALEINNGNINLAIEWLSKHKYI